MKAQLTGTATVTGSALDPVFHDDDQARGEIFTSKL